MCRRTASHSIVPDLATELALERGRQGADLPAAPAASNGMTASRSPRPTSNAPGTGCAAVDADKFRINPRKAWYRNLDEITTNGDYEVTFHLKRPQPYLIALLASGQSPVYPCHVPTAQMRTAPDRHRPVQIRRVQAERAHQGDPQPGLLEAGPALSRRHRIHDHRQPGDRHPRLCRRQARFHLRRRSRC